MSAFHCDRCDNIRDSHDGCEESPNGLGLICIDCMADMEDERAEAEDRRRANPLEPDFRRYGQ